MTSEDAKKIDREIARCMSGVHPEELALGYLRYEALRRLTPREFTKLYKRNLASNPFDDLVDALVLGKP